MGEPAKWESNNRNEGTARMVDIIQRGKEKERHQRTGKDSSESAGVQDAVQIQGVEGKKQEEGNQSVASKDESAHEESGRNKREATGSESRKQKHVPGKEYTTKRGYRRSNEGMAARGGELNKEEGEIRRGRKQTDGEISKEGGRKGENY